MASGRSSSAVRLSFRRSISRSIDISIVSRDESGNKEKDNSLFPSSQRSKNVR